MSAENRLHDIIQLVGETKLDDNNDPKLMRFIAPN